MKFTRYIRKNLEVIYKIIDIQNIEKKTMQAIIRFCTYDHRKRKNFEIQLDQIILEIN